MRKLTTAERRRVRDNLKAAYALIADPRRWVRGVSAVDKYGMMTAPKSPAAVRWCAVGAVRRTQPSEYTGRMVMRALEDVVGGQSIIAVNDNGSVRLARRRVLATFRQAIRNLGGRV